jgi:hypothetical protein
MHMHLIFAHRAVNKTIYAKSNNSNSAIEVIYHRYNNGKKVNGYEFILKHFKQFVLLSRPNDEIRYYMEYRNLRNVDMIDYKGTPYKTFTPFDSLPKSRFGDKKDTILGYECQYASFDAFSYNIEVYYTEEAGIRGHSLQGLFPFK